MGFSPCPNDTFMFHDVAANALVADGYAIDVHLHDVETLNELAFTQRYDLTKVSAAAAMRLRDTYQFINAGGAFGFGCGPLVVTRHALQRKHLAQARIAAPGKWTTAHLLFQLWAPSPAATLFMPYDRIIQAVASGEADAGILIHESRFVLAQTGLRQLADLGAWWEAETGLPIPLGGVMARRSLGPAVIADLDRLLKRGIAHSRAEPQGTLAYVQHHAVELDETVVRRHIDLYVTSFSEDMGHRGRQALVVLEEMARAAGVMT